MSGETSSVAAALDDVDASYASGAGKEPAISGVSIEVRRGSFTALIGSSGSGKSTVGRVVLLLMRAARGRVLRFGRDVTDSRRADPAVRRLVQPVFQHPGASLDPTYDVFRTLLEPLRLVDKSLRREDARDAAAALLRDVGLSPDFFDRSTTRLSGGEQQRLCIARALAARPDALVLDEPLSALDVAIQARVMDLLLRLRAERGLAYLFITHDLRLVRTRADYAYVMERGRVVEEGSAAEVATRPRSAAARRIVSSALPADPAAARAALRAFDPSL
jgi:peptide/nickel transport system ATP-binding protein